jgi:hypothetical protein
MKSLKSRLVILGSAGLLFLGACSNGTQANNSTVSTEVASPVATTAKTDTAKSETKTDTAKSETKTEQNAGEHSHSHKEGEEHSHGGQVVDVGQYHLELVADKHEKETHFDFFLEKGEKHEKIANAKVTALVQLPDGTEKTLDLKYDTKGQHYTALLPGTAAGQYQVRVTADIGGEKVNGRFTVNQ